MTVDQLATFLQRDAREVHKWASRGYLPARKSLIDSASKFCEISIQ